MHTKILIVEDCSDTQLALSIRLQRSGFAVLKADSIANAKQLVVSETPNLIVLDLGLPDGDGRTLMEYLNSSSATSSIPVIVLTARDQCGIQECSYDGGAVDFFQKPVPYKWLLSSIERALEQVS
jgi:two-component system, OmpR family, KDP operon response regulator KdpE